MIWFRVVERKSISDLIGSLASGRLYSQCESMIHHYKIPILLIEFDPDKPFTFMGHESLTDDVEFKNTSSKLALLTLTFPQIRILWSRSPRDTVTIFMTLKQHEPPPDLAVSMAMGKTGRPGNIYIYTL